MVTLAGLMAVALPALVYTYMLSGASTTTGLRAMPENVSSWETFGTEVAAACDMLDDSTACHEAAPFPKRQGGAFTIRVIACSSN